MKESPHKMENIKTLDLDFGNIDLYDKYVIAKLKTGISFDKEHLMIYRQIFSDFYGDKPYVYISDRSNDYNVNPIAYLNLDFATNLVAAAIVCPSSTCKRSAEFESNFFKKRLEIFETMEEAITWAEKLV